MKGKEYQVHTLSNGIRIIHQEVKNIVSYCGILINTGSRDELDEEHGLAHYIEHALFKGTKKRKAYHILSRLEDVGGEINAYTTKEETCIHSTFLDGDYNRALDLMSDILFCSAFPEKELAREREVIIDEINSYEDSPSELIFDDFEELIYRDSPIGRNILGTPDSLRLFSKKYVTAFMSRTYNTDEIVLSSVGNISFKKLVKLAEKYFAGIPENRRSYDRLAFTTYLPISKTLKKNTSQAHCVIGNIAYGVKDSRRITLQLLNNLLGGQGLNSRLNLSLREKNGYAYNVESNYNPYQDSGVASIYFGTDQENLNKSLKIVHRELKRLRDVKLGTLQLSKAKKQLIGQIAISSEMHENLMLSMGKSLLVFNEVDTIRDLAIKIESITANQLLAVANEVFDAKQLSQLVYI